MSVLTSPVLPYSWFGRAWEVLSDVLIATALMWTPPLLLGGAAALIRFLLQTS